MGHEHASDRELRLAAAIREHYRKERSIYETAKNGGTRVEYVPPARFDGRPAKLLGDRHPPKDALERVKPLERAKPSLWLRLARYFRAGRIDPFLYISCQFELAPEAVLGRAPEPDDLDDAACRERYAIAYAAAEARLAQSLPVQKGLAALQIKTLRALRGVPAETAWAAVLCDRHLELSALFRYCLASSIAAEGRPEFADIADRFRGEAITQFERYRDLYLKHWRAVLPEGFADEARQDYAALLGGDEEPVTEDFP
jgi:hypothetical protein